MRIVWVDTETTSVDPWRCRAVEVALYEHGPMSAPWVFRCNPGVRIDPGAIEAHGITDADVADRPPFAEFAPGVQALVDGAALAGYHIRSFDTIVLDRELRLAGQPGLMRNDTGTRIVHPEIDLLRLWKDLEPRTLEGALKRFLGAVPAEFAAHTAGGDVFWLGAVLDSMARVFADQWPVAPDRRGGDDEHLGLAAMCVPAGEVDRDGKFKRDESGIVRVNFGKHGPGGSDAEHPEGTAASRVPASYLEWVAEKASDMPEDAREVARWYLSRRPGWLNPEPKSDGQGSLI